MSASLGITFDNIDKAKNSEAKYRLTRAGIGKTRVEEAGAPRRTPKTGTRRCVARRSPMPAARREGAAPRAGLSRPGAGPSLLAPSAALLVLAAVPPSRYWRSAVAAVGPTPLGTGRARHG